MNEAITVTGGEFQSVIGVGWRLLFAVLVLGISYIIGRYAARAAIVLLHRSALQNLHKAFFGTAITSVFVFLGIAIALGILGLEQIAVSLLAGGGVTAIILGFAFREIGENFLAGLFLAISRPFNVGDLIRTEDIEGSVREIALRYTHIRTEDGQDVYVPSSQLFNRPVVNFTRDGLRRISFTIGIDYAEDAEAASKLLAQTVLGSAGVLEQPGPGAYISMLAPQYVELTVFYWFDVFAQSRTALATRTGVMNGCRRALLEAGFVVSSDTTSNIAIVEAAGSRAVDDYPA